MTNNCIIYDYYWTNNLTGVAFTNYGDIMLKMNENVKVT